MNLMDMIKDQVSGSLVTNASKFLGESESGVGKALEGIFPAVLGKMIDKSEDEDGLSKLFDMAKGSDAGILDNIGGLFGGGAGNVAKLMNGGSGILNLLLGNNTGGLIEKIAGFSGLKGSAASSLIKMAAPFLMSMVGRQIKNKALDAVGLGKLLGSQKAHVKSAMPSGLLSSLGAGFLGKGFDAVSGIAGDGLDAGKKVVGNAADLGKGAVGAVGDLGKGAVGAVGDLGKGAVGAVGDLGKGAVGAVGDLGKGAVGAVGDVGGAAVKSGGSILKWLIPVFLLLLGGSFFGYKTGCSAVDDTVGSAKDLTENVAGGAADLAGDAAGAVGDAASAVGDAVGGAFSKVDEMAKKALDGISFAAGSAGDQMTKFIDGGFKGDSRFRFKNLTFNSGSAAIGGETGSEVDNLAAILKAYPGVNIHIDGYTDNTGDAAKNVQLSNARALAVKARLQSKGIAGDRITAKGNGDADPVADNGTAEGQAQNRRIEVSIVK